MWLLSKLFGGGDKKKTPIPFPPKSEEQIIAEKKILIEKVLKGLDDRIKNLEEKEIKLDLKVEFLRNKAKDMLRVDKKREARKYAEEVIRVSNHAETHSIRKKMQMNKKFQLEQELMDLECPMFQELNWQTQNQEYQKDLQHVILSEQEEKNRQRGIIAKMIDEQSDYDEVEELLNELMEELRLQNTNKAESDNSVSVNARTAKTKRKEADDIEKMLASLQQT